MKERKIIFFQESVILRLVIYCTGWVKYKQTNKQNKTKQSKKQNKTKTKNKNKTKQNNNNNNKNAIINLLSVDGTYILRTRKILNKLNK